MKVFYTHTTWNRLSIIPSIEFNRGYDMKVYHVVFSFLPWCIVIRFGKDSKHLA